ncbi:tail tubular protein B [Enterobacter phage NJ2]|uniref:Tail tubular protein B n=1 Tax=Enterobacter phage NJ2 TaxID=3108955 RepID=A0ABZ0ZX45_9CAUD|nr:tail tubular protein B [Enterobacter phage NJ2]
MGLISQSIKNLKGGISQQPDILRFPEQGAAQINGWSSETEGLQKRPPLLFNRTIDTAASVGAAPYVHLINRDEFEQYHVVFTGTSIRVFDLDGVEYPVDYENNSQAYIQTANPRDDLRMVTVADYTFVVNRKRVVQVNPNSKNDGGAFNPKQDALINVRGGQYGRTLSVSINGGTQASYKIPDGDKPTDVGNTDAQWLAEELARQLRANTPGWAFHVGQGYIWIVAPAGQEINSLVTKDGYADQLISPVTHYAQSFAKLPINAPDGYRVKIVGDTSKTADQYYVRYDATRKVWSECPAWNITTQFYLETMPHALVRKADGRFAFRWNSWNARSAGDDDTNPYPSFVDNTINDVFFFRNRLGFLSGENIILSRTAKYFNFFPPSVANLSDDDPIDVAVSHNRVSTLKYAVPFTEELLLWSDEAQFVLGASGILSSKTVELNLTTQFDVQDKSRPYGIGRNVYFASPRATYTSMSRYYAVQDVSSVKSAEDITAHVPNYIPNGVFSISGTSSENFATVLTSGAKGKVFIYKFLYLDEELRQQSWSHWDFGDNVEVLAANCIGSRMYILMRNQFNLWSCEVNFTKESIDYDIEPYRVHLDMKKAYTIPSDAFNEDTFQTSLSISAVYQSNFQRGSVTIVEADGKTTTIPAPEGGWNSSPWISLDGNLAGKTVIIGFNYEFRYEFSKFLIKKAADDGSTATEDIGRLQLRRAWLNYERSGAFTIQVQNLSRVFEYDMAGGRLGSDNLRIGRLNLGTGQYRFPVAGNASYNTVILISDNTTPLNVIGCGWEGNYIRRSSGI